LSSVLFFVSCKTKETIAKQDKKIQGLDKIKLTPPAINTANFSKLSVDIKSPGNTLSSAASMKIIRDSIIQISVQPMLGIEMARVDFFKNDIVIIDKMNSRYLKTNYEFLFTRFRVKADFNSLQALLLNELFILGESSSPFDSLVAHFSTAPFPDGVMLKSKSTKAWAPTEFILNNDNNISYTSITMPLCLLTCRYSDFTKDGGVNFPFTYKISIIDGPITRTADISVQAVEFNMPVKINSSNLSNYEQVNTFEQLIP
jgi:hypothetical protein